MPAKISRRGFLKGAAAVAGGVVATSCSTTTSASGGSAPKVPRRGGTLTCGFGGGTSSDTLDAQSAVNPIDFARIIQLYDPLANYDPAGHLQLVLAEEAVVSSDATSWTIRLRPGVSFHNGKDFTADDVIYSLRRITNPKLPLVGASELSLIDAAGLTKLDDLTVRVPCHAPFSTLVEELADYATYIVPVGYDPRKPVGTGAFKYESFTPGLQSTFVRNESYWQHGLPYVDRLVIDDYADEVTQVDGLVAGQLDVIDQLSAGSLHAMPSSAGHVIVNGGACMVPFGMRVDVPPFTDVRVRQAMRLIVDRERLRQNVTGGYGELGNDVFSITDPAYDHLLPQRHQDISQAKFLLKQAGHDSLNLELVTSDIGGGVVSSAEVLAEEAKAAGVTITLNQVTPTDFFGVNYLKWTFTQDIWYGLYYLAQVSQSTVPLAPFDETHFDNPAYNQLYQEALRTISSDKRTEIEHAMQLIDYDSGGYIIPVFNAPISAVGKQVQGIAPATGIGLPVWGYGLKTCWLA